MGIFSPSRHRERQYQCCWKSGRTAEAGAPDDSGDGRYAGGGSLERVRKKKQLSRRIEQATTRWATEGKKSELALRKDKDDSGARRID